MTDIPKKDLAMWVLIGLSSVTGLGNTVYETQFEDHGNPAQVAALEDEVAELEKKIVSLTIQNCLIINQVNRNAGEDELTECGP